MPLKKAFKYGYINAMCRAIKSSLLPGEVFERLVSADTTGDIFVTLRETSYLPFIKSAIERELVKGVELHFENVYAKIKKRLKSKEREVFEKFFFGRRELLQKKRKLKAKKNADELYRKLDLEFLKELLESFKKLPSEDRKDLESILGSYYNVLNVMTAARLRMIYRFPPDEVRKYIVPYGFAAKSNFANLLSKIETFGDIVKLLPELFEEAPKDFIQLRKALYSYHIKELSKVWFGQPFKLSVPFSLLRHKEIEKKNLIACIEGVSYGLPPSEIENMLVGVG